MSFEKTSLSSWTALDILPFNFSPIKIFKIITTVLIQSKIGRIRIFVFFFICETVLRKVWIIFTESIKLTEYITNTRSFSKALIWMIAQAAQSDMISTVHLNSQPNEGL